ncbi:hypothetical protein JYT32_00195 [Dehalococcoides mccartyi]|nr:hypothetical protein [Dehalococcoides mccartyi]
MTRVLVAYATRFGSTHEIASAIAHELNTAGLTAHAAETSSGLSVEDYDAFVIGSPLYGGTWPSNAGVFAAVMAERMNGKPTALFSVGTLMLKNPERGQVEHTEFIAGLAEVALGTTGLNVVASALFSGYFDRANLPWLLRLIDRFAPTPQGDHRNWPEIQAWAKSLVPKFAGS